MDSLMQARTSVIAAAIGLVLSLTGCLDQRLGRGDRYRAIRGDAPPRPAAALQIPTPPTAALASSSDNVKPAR
jgi:hypothetical protein